MSKNIEMNIKTENGYEVLYPKSTPEQVGCTTQAWVEEYVSSNYLSLSGGTMTGSIDMGGQKISGVGAPSESGDVVNKGYVDNIAPKIGIDFQTWQLLYQSNTNKVRHLVEFSNIGHIPAKILFLITYYSSSSSNISLDTGLDRDLIANISKNYSYGRPLVVELGLAAFTYNNSVIVSFVNLSRLETNESNEVWLPRQSDDTKLEDCTVIGDYTFDLQVYYK